MGRWRITVEGVGCHHNGNRAIDANLATADFVKVLKKQGHQIQRAKFELLGTPEGADVVAVGNAQNIDFLAPAADAGEGAE